MNISNRERVIKLGSSLARHPSHIPLYMRYSILNRKLPVHIGLPWWSFLAIDAVDKIAPGRRIFEFGTGGSTIRYARVAQSLVSVEDDGEWATLVSSTLRARDSRADIVVHPFNFYEPKGFADSAYLNECRRHDWDMCFIDGQDITFRERITCFRLAESLARPGSVILVDDFWRYEELITQNKADRVEVFESTGPCRLGVTSTALFFY